MPFIYACQVILCVQNTMLNKTCPKVSIVIPVYNRAKYIGTAVESVLWQTYKDWELIISDDGSTDGSLEIAQNFATHDSRIQVLTNSNRPTDDTNRGAVNALIAGFDVARGEYIGQLDSDDLLEPQAIELSVAALDTNPNWGMVYSNYLDINEFGEKLRPGWRCSIPYSRAGLLTAFMTFHFRMIRTTAYWVVGGFDVMTDRIEDYDLCLRLSEATNIGKIDDFLYQYRRHPGSLMYSIDVEILLQIKEVIERGMMRRGMESTHKLKVEFNPKFTIESI